METITVAARKGGVGRTMVANNLIWHFVEDPKARVLALDLDPYGIMTKRLHGFQDAGDVNTLFRGDVEVPSGKHVCLGTDSMIDDFSGDRGIELFSQIRRNLARWASHFDYCVIDTPVETSTRSLSSLVVSDHVIVPCEPCPWAIGSLNEYYVGYDPSAEPGAQYHVFVRDHYGFPIARDVVVRQGERRFVLSYVESYTEIDAMHGQATARQIAPQRLDSYRVAKYALSTADFEAIAALGERSG